MSRAVKSLKSGSKLSHYSLAVFLVIFALVGGSVLLLSHASPNPNLPGDLNNDNKVDGADLAFLASVWKTSNASADLNSDSTVNIADLSILLAHYGQTLNTGQTTATYTCGWGSYNTLPLNIPTGCWRPFADNSWLNTPLPANPQLTSDSATLVNNLFCSTSPCPAGGDGTARIDAYNATPYFESPLYFSCSKISSRCDHVDPAYQINCTGARIGCQDENGVATQGQIIYLPCGAKQATGSDGQLDVFDQDLDTNWSLGAVTNVLPTSNCPAGPTVISGRFAAKFYTSGLGRAACSDAACVSGMAGQMREQELAAGHIDHALGVVTRSCNGGNSYPGYSANSPSCANANPLAPANGQWFYLDLTASDIAALNVKDWQKIILTALSKYGFFVKDQGSNGAFEIQTEGPGTYYSGSDAWFAWANSQVAKYGSASAAGLGWSGSGQLSFNFDTGLGPAFWRAHAHVVAACVIQKTC